MRHDQRFQVSFHYPVVFTEDAFAIGNEDLAAVMPAPCNRPARVLAVMDRGVAAAHPHLLGEIQTWCAAHRAANLELAAEPLVVPGGETAKQDLSVVWQVAQLAAELRLCRHSYLLAIGGGAMLDAVGLAAALIHRGLRLVRLPTTVLAQNDAGLGVKNGINAFGSKNAMGTFAPPWAVVNDRRFLTTLDDRAWRDGIAEAFKVAIIKDAAFLSWLIAHAGTLAGRDRQAMDHLICTCARLHLDHIAEGGDPFETGSSRPLDFGHWAAHRLEALSRHRLSHGEAVAIGLAIDLGYAVRKGFFPAAAAALTLEALETLGFRLNDPTLELRGADGRLAILAGIEQFREHLGGELTIAMPDGPGRRQDVHALDEPVLVEVLAELGIAASLDRARTRSSLPRR